MFFYLAAYPYGLNLISRHPKTRQLIKIRSNMAHDSGLTPGTGKMIDAERRAAAIEHYII